MPKHAPKRPPPASSYAIRQLTSWLEAAGIPITQSQEIDGDWSFTVRKVSGSDLDVIVDSKDVSLPFKVGSNFAMVPGKMLLEPARAAEVFRQIADAAGYRVKVPVFRGVPPADKITYVENFDLVVIRHCEFRRVPNPSPDTLKKYKQVALNACYAFLRSNSYVCARNAYDLSDLLQYALLWTCNYHGLYEVPAHRNRANDNEKLLFTHLQQRFAEFRKLLLKKSRSCTPDHDTAAAALFERPYGATIEAEMAVNPFDAEPDQGRDEDPALFELRHKLRREAAADRLSRVMAALPHAEVVERLAEAAESLHLAPDVSDEAARQLQLHRKRCVTCRAAAAAA